MAGDLAQGTLHGPVYARALNQHTVRQRLCYSRYLCVLQSLAVLWVNNVLLYQHGGQGAEQTTSFKMLWQKKKKEIAHDNKHYCAVNSRFKLV